MELAVLLITGDRTSNDVGFFLNRNLVPGLRQFVGRPNVLTVANFSHRIADWAKKADKSVVEFMLNSDNIRQAEQSIRGMFLNVVNRSTPEVPNTIVVFEDFTTPARRMRYLSRLPGRFQRAAVVIKTLGPEDDEIVPPTPTEGFDHVWEFTLGRAGAYTETSRGQHLL